MRLGERAAEHGEVLGEDEDRAAVDGAPAGDDAVAGDLDLLHAEIGRAVLDEHVELLEGALVEQKLDALAGRQLAAAVLRLDALLAAAEARLGAPLFKPFEHVFHGWSLILGKMIPRLAQPCERQNPTMGVCSTALHRPAKAGYDIIVITL